MGLSNENVLNQEIREACVALSVQRRRCKDPVFDDFLQSNLSTMIV